MWASRAAVVPRSRATHLRSPKPGLDLSFDARLHRQSDTDHLDFEYDYGETKSTRTVVLVGPGARFTRKSGWARRFFQGNAWLSEDTQTTEFGGYEYRTQRTAPGLGFALGFDVQLSRRLTVPLAVRYDHLIRSHDDERLTSVEGALAYSWEP